MTCQEFVEFIIAYLERETSAEQRAVFEEHIAACPPCLTYLDQYRDTVALGIAACREPDGPVPEDAPERLVQAVLAARAHEQSR